MVDLTTTYMGIELKNPLIVAAGTTTHTPEMGEKAAKCGWAAVVLNTFYSAGLQKRCPLRIARPHYLLLDGRGLSRWKPIVPKVSAPRRRGGKFLGKIQPDYVLAFASRSQREIPYEYRVISPTYYTTPESYLYFINKTVELCKDYDCKIIASLAALNEEEWETACDVVNRSKADGVELNFGCVTSGTEEPKTGEVLPSVPLGFYPENVEKWAKFIIPRIKKIPVSIKLPPTCPDPLGVARVAVESGARGIQFANAGHFAPPIPPLVINPETAAAGVFPGLPFSSGLYPSSPSWVLAYVCGIMAHYRLNGIEIDLSGCGGVREAMDVIRILMAGATSVQVCSATIVEGLEIGGEYLQEMIGYMERQGYKSLKDFQGIMADRDKLKIDVTKLIPAAVPQRAGGPVPDVQVVLNERRCINCGWCESCCPELAIKIESKKPIIAHKLCEVCGICVALCPSEALSIQPGSNKEGFGC